MELTDRQKKSERKLIYIVKISQNSTLKLQKTCNDNPDLKTIPKLKNSIEWLP